VKIVKSLGLAPKGALSTRSVSNSKTNMKAAAVSKCNESSRFPTTL
jgi:hypothetical protein